MKLINTMHDNLLKKPYKLYQVNAKQMSERLHNSYGLDKLSLQMFNSDAHIAEYAEQLRDLRAKGHKIDDNNLDVKRLNQAIHKVENNEHMSSLDEIGISFGYELMPIAICTEGDFEDPSTKIELIDGFKRMFCMNKIPDIELLVKVYERLTDREWINAMILYNSWKFTNGEGSRVYMDRGFQLGLSYRHNINFVDMHLNSGSIMTAINLFTSGNDLDQYGHRQVEGGAYYSFWNNDQFANDIRAIHMIMSYKPVFVVKKKGKPNTELRPGDNGRRNIGLVRVLQVFVSLLGEIRRYEEKTGIGDRKPFDIKVLAEYFADDDIQKQMIKLCQMTVDGFIINHIKTYMREFIKDFFYVDMGYSYTKKVENQPDTHMIISADMM
jgi:hypothetical protein